MSRGRDGALYRDGDRTLRVQANEGAALRLAEVTKFHCQLTSPFVEVQEATEGSTLFAFDGCATLVEVVEGVLAGSLPTISFSMAAAFIDHLMDAVERAHCQGVYLRSLGPGNILISRTGGIHVLGAGGLRISEPAFSTPAVSTGAPATAASDMYAAMQVLRYALPAVDLPMPLRRVFQGTPTAAESVFWKQLSYFEQRLSIPALDTRKLRVRHARRTYHAFWKLMGLKPDREALQVYAQRAHALLWPERPEARYDASADTLSFASGLELRLGNHPVQARLLAALVESHRDPQCEGLSADELIARLWPDERMSPESARNRLYVTVSKLRKAGLASVLELDANRRYRFVSEFVLR